MKIKGYLCLFCLILPSLQGMAQSQTKAKELFKEGKYAEAKPLFEKLWKKNPRNGSLSYWYGACLFETGEAELGVPHLEYAAERKVRDAYRYLAMNHQANYHFAEAEADWETYMEEMEKAKKPVADSCLTLHRQATIGKQMMHSVADVTVIDSVVVDKESFLSAYRLSEEAGTLETIGEFFNDANRRDGIVYLTEMENRIYYSDATKDGGRGLYVSDLIGGNWGEGHLLAGVPEGADYPYMLSDGATFYFAAEGEKSLGGYDICVTRYDSENDRFLLSENIGMPFNSPYNDYMYVIDEFNGFGWFASDRYQPEGKVCVYVFLSSEIKVLDEEQTHPDVLISRARMASIKETWGDEDAVRKGRQKLAMNRYDRPDKVKRGDFEFVIDDHTVYHKKEDFRCKEALESFTRWQQEQKNLTTLAKRLEEKRDEYARGNAQKRSGLTSEILDLEKRVEALEESVYQLELEARNAENRFLGKR